MIELADSIFAFDTSSPTGERHIFKDLVLYVDEELS